MGFKVLRKPDIHQLSLRSVVICVLCITLLACQKEDEIDLDAPSLQITSPLPGDDVSGNKTITLSGTVSSDTVSVTVAYDGNLVNATLAGTDFSANITLNEGSNSITATAKDATGNSRSFTFNLFYPVLALTDGAAASLVIGQADFTSNTSNQGSTVAANTLSGVTGTLFQRNHTGLYIPDSGNNRILGFTAVPASSNAGAGFVIGQADLTSVDSGTSASRFISPGGVYATDTQFFVADTGNHRVLIWDSIPNNGSTDADYVIGQADLTSGGGPGCSSSTLSAPSSVFVVDDKVVVLDQGNNRVLIWNAIPATNGVAADLVIGQQNLSSCQPNDSVGDNVTDSITASTLKNPGGIWTDGARLLVADTDNHRVLVWDTFPTSNGQAADWVIGQSDKTSAVLTNPPSDGSDLNSPKSVTSNGNQIFVADTGNYRALIWNSFPTTDKPVANNVIGQADFVSNTPMLSESTLESADNVFVDRDNLYVVDGNRILMFANP